jgi:hypothetical protein
MKIVELQQKSHDFKIGDITPTIAPNVHEDCIFTIEGEPVGFFLQKMPEKSCALANLANAELRSKNVPKSTMDRKAPRGFDEEKGVYKYEVVSQHSVILGSVAPKPHMRRNYPSMSSVHSCKTAQNFIKAMFMLSVESEKLIADIIPQQHAAQVKLFEHVNKKWRFGNIFTSSISNYNIAAPFHRDAGNIVGAVNVIITKRENSTGGNLYIPDYDACIDQCDNSILVYPAWRNLHGVTPIETTKEGGYRNSLVFYPLKAFVGRD